MLITKPQIDFYNAYIEALYFTETGDGEQPDADATLSPEFIRSAQDECRRFWNTYSEIIPESAISQAGHDFWLTRNRHGAGFWDRPEIYGERNAQELTRASHLLGESYAEFLED